MSIVIHLTTGQTSLCDAYTEDGTRVMIKEIGRNDEESRIARMLSSEQLQGDPRNHCIPILDVIDDPDDATKSYMIMPLLRPADKPPFQYVKETVDFVDQMLEVCPSPTVASGSGLQILGTRVPSRERGCSPVTTSHDRMTTMDSCFPEIA